MKKGSFETELEFVGLLHTILPRTWNILILLLLLLLLFKKSCDELVIITPSVSTTSASWSKNETKRGKEGTSSTRNER